MPKKSKQKNNTDPVQLEPIYQKLGVTIRAHRLNLKLSQKELGDRCGISRGTISNIEGGRYRIQLHDLESLAKALETDMVRILSGYFMLPTQE